MNTEEPMNTEKPMNTETETEHVAIVILSDGQTWSGIDNTAIAIVTRADFDRLLDGEKLHRIQPVMEIGLHDFSLPATERGGA